MLFQIVKKSQPGTNITDRGRHSDNLLGIRKDTFITPLYVGDVLLYIHILTRPGIIFLGIMLQNSLYEIQRHIRQNFIALPNIKKHLSFQTY